MQEINAQHGKQAIAGLDQAKFKELKRSLNGVGKKFDLEELTKEELQAQRAEVLERNEEAAVMFENYFATMLVKEMRSSLSTGFFNGPGSDAYGAWFDEHLGAALKKGDGLGVGEMIRGALTPDASRSLNPLDQSLGEFQALKRPLEFQELKESLGLASIQSPDKGASNR